MKSLIRKKETIQHLFNVNYNNTKIFNFEFSVILSEELEWFQRLDHCVLNLLSSSNMRLNDWLNQTTDYTVWSTFIDLRHSSLPELWDLCHSVLCFINQGPQCRLVLFLNFLRNPEGQKEFGVPRAIVSSILVLFWIVEKVWIGNFLLLISEGFSLKAHTLLSVIWGQLASSNLLVEYVPTRNPRIKFILVIFSFSDW